MRSIAKASSAGSNQRQATGLGRFFRGAFATRGASGDANGSGAPRARRLVVPAAVLALALALVAIPVSASKVNLFKGVFGAAAQPEFSNDRGIAVDQDSGDVLVLEVSEDEIRRYKPNGTPSNFAVLGSNVIDGEGSGPPCSPPSVECDGTPDGNLEFPGSARESQIAVDNSGGATDGNIYVTEKTRDQISIFASSGEYLGELTEHSGGKFNEPLGVAVDPLGNVYVGDFHNVAAGDLVHKYEPSGSIPVKGDNVASFNSLLGTSSIGTLAAGAGPTAGFIFVNRNNGELFKLDDTTGELKYQIATNAPTVYVDPGTGHVIVPRLTSASSEVVEYDASGPSSATVVSSFKPGSTVEGVAVNGGAGNIYLSRALTTNVEVYGVAVTVPEPITEPASGVTTTEATVNGTVNPDGQALTECFFEWGTSAAYGNIAPCAETVGEIGAGTTPVPVHADLTGLDVGTIYHYRLVAVNANDTVRAGDETLQTPGPRIAATWSQDVVLTEAFLKASINPEGKATTYHFEYGKTTAYGSETPELPVGSGSSDQVVSRFLEGLQPGTTYHYRVVATNADAVNEGPDRTFKTYSLHRLDSDCLNQGFRIGPAAHLPDCRAYEMVSPIDKNGGDIETAEEEVGFGHRSSSYRRASVAGGKITFSSATAFGDAVGGHWSNQYIASRGSEGWSTHSISSRRGQTVFEPIIAFGVPARWFLYGFFQGFSPDLSTAWVRDDNVVPLAPSALQGYVNLYRRDNAGDFYQPLTVTDQEPFGANVRAALSKDGNGNTGGPRFLGASSDLRHQVFVVNAPLTADAVPVPGPEQATSQLYDLVDGELHLVSVLPNGEAAPGNSFAGTASDSAFVETRAQMLKNAVSDDGSRVVWTNNASSTTGGPGAIYVRENPDEEQSVSGECDEPGKACTIHVAGEAGLFSPNKAQFWAASASGSHLLFSLGDHPNRTLYLFDVETEAKLPIAGGVRAVSAAAEDLSHVYFVSSQDLDEGGPANEGEHNLYLFQEGSYAFIATLTGDDVSQLVESNHFSGNAVGLQGTGPKPIYNQTRVTPGGGYFTFMSNSGVLSKATAGYDNADIVTGKPDFQVYRYDAAADELSCLSCKPSGARPRGHLVRAVYSPLDHEFTSAPELRVAGSIPTHEHDNYASRVLSDDGQRLFFHSDDALLPRDTNGIQDVYQWQAPGSGSCDVGDPDYFAQNDGCISLISTGRDDVKSEFVDANPDGDEVYISVDESLDPRDPGLRDIYVAKVGGGFPLPTRTAPCEGEACQSPPPPPESPDPASTTFSGPGDPRKAGPSCNALARRALRLSRLARRQRQAAKRSKVQGKSRARRRDAARSARRARALSKRAKRCRARTNRQASTSRRAGR